MKNFYYLLLLIGGFIISSFIFIYAARQASADLASWALEEYYNAYVAMDVNRIADKSIDEEYETKEEYKSALRNFLQSEEAQIISYKIISKEKYGDGYAYTVRHVYKNNTVAEGKRYVKKIDKDWVVYLPKDPSLRAFQLIAVPEEKKGFFETYLKPMQGEAI